MWKFAAAAAVAAVWVTGAHAQDQQQVRFAPPAAWVRPAGEIKTDSPDDGAAVRFLLMDSQLHFGEDGSTVYAETAIRVQTPQGLQAMSTVTLPWDPALGGLTVHKLRLLRGGQVIDLLAKQKFTVLRRESNLEAQQLDGVLTAVLQPEDLRVGDIIDLAFSINTKDPALSGHVQWDTAAPNVVIDDLRLHASSDKGPISWRATEGIEGLKPGVTGEGRSVSVTMKDVQPLLLPENAPVRFRWGRVLQVSDFKSWAEVSAVMAPLYAKAATLSATSPLQAEIARIKAASPDPKSRAEAALALVENQIRYVALAMDDGGYVPAAADATWSRRFGDCKGKTVLLMSLLKGLGIEAQPALVSSQLGDGLDQRLPSAGVFDHVIVRATIGGKVYWLDGTRLGDLKLDDIPVPAFVWALPLQTASATLTPVMPGPLEHPDTIRSIRIDASAGLDVPAPTHVEAVFRGDAAYGLNATVANLTPAQKDAGLRQYWSKSLSFLTVTKATATYDPVKHEERFVADGTSKMDWEDGTTCCRLYEPDGYGMGWKADYTRPAGPHSDAPFAASFPMFEENQETIILPYRGAGFTLQGDQIDRKVGAWSFHRAMKIEKGVFTLDASTRSLAPEFTPSDADATTLKDMAKVAVYVVSPRTYQMTRQELDLYEARSLTTFKDYLARGEAMLRRARYAKCRGDLEKAVALDAKSSEAKAYLAECETLTGDPAAAHALLKQALDQAPDDLTLVRSAMFLANFENNRADQDAYYDRVLAKKPQDAAWLLDRASTYMRRGQAAEALAITDQVLKADAKNQNARRLRVAAEVDLRRGEQALQELDAAIAAEPRAAYLHQLRGGVLQVVKDDAAAQAEYDAALALDKTSDGYVRRADARAPKDYDRSLADLEEALKLKPDNRGALIRRARTEAVAGKIGQALAHVDALAADNPDDVAVREARAWVYARAGKTDLAVADMDWIRTFADPSSGNLNNLCYAEATSNLSLTKALADCSRAVELAPGDAPPRDSLAFVLLRLDRVDEALAEYDRTLKLSPYETASLFGRALARMRKGRLNEARADLDAAKALNPHIEDVFAHYGVNLPQTVASSNSATK